VNPTAELVAARLNGSATPDYASAFSIERLQDPDCLARIEAWGDSGQL
jgi:hypothetical protein